MLTREFVAYLAASRSAEVLDDLLAHLEEVATGRVRRGGA